mgnify:CR=1 FL=1
MGPQLTGDAHMLRTVLALGALSALAAPAWAQSEPGSVYFQIDSCASYQLPGEPVWETACAAHDSWSIFLHSTEHGSGIAYAYNGSEPLSQLLPNLIRHNVEQYTAHHEAD